MSLTVTHSFVSAIADGADATLVAIETNPDFVRHLKETISDPRLHVVAGSAAQVDLILRRFGLSRADYITASYAALYFTWRRAHGEEPSDMVFRKGRIS